MKPRNYPIFGQKLKRLREEKAVSQEHIAFKLGFKSNSYISDVEHGCFFPSKDKMKVWANILGLSMKDIEDLKLEAKIEELGISDPSFTLMFKEVPNLTSEEKQSIIKAFEAVQASRAKKRKN